jgi:acyl-CoA synthetase (AMP-forming)/AMP-acid ligase II
MSENPPTLVSVTELLPLAATPPDTTATHPGVAAMLAERLRRDPGRPAVTFYDDATGERVELSTATLDNWVAKTANMLVDTLGLAPGDMVAVDLPAHWSTAAILLAAWSAGAEVLLASRTSQIRSRSSHEVEIGGADPEGTPGVVGTATSGVKVAFVAADRVEEALAEDADEVVALSLRPLGGRLAHPLAGMLDYAAEVPGHGDHFHAPAPPVGQEALLRFTAHVAEAWGLGPSDRVLSAAPIGTADGLVAGLLAPLVVGASVVLCRRLDTALLPRRVAAERVTAVCGLGGTAPAGTRTLSVPAGRVHAQEPASHPAT